MYSPSKDSRQNCLRHREPGATMTIRMLTHDDNFLSNYFNYNSRRDQNNKISYVFQKR